MLLRKSQSAVSVLVVEDDLISRKALAALFASAGYLPLAADSAERALHMVHAGSSPQLAVVDLDLPGMNGWELIRKLRKGNKRLISVLVTANSQDDIRELLDEDPMPYMRKPVDFPELMVLLTEQGNIA